MSELDNDQLPVQDELTALKARADMMGLSYHPSIGLEKLRDKVNAAVEGTPETPDAEQSVEEAAVEETENQKRQRLKNDANRLIRVRVACMNPAKKEWEGEFFSAGNSIIGTMTKYVPFNAEDGWHVPNMILKMIQDRQCQVFYTVSDARGNKSRKGKLIKEFSVEVLPDLTPEELHDLAQRQAMGNNID